MNEIKIYIRTDLRTNESKKVPNGKMASQAAHALMASLLSLFEKNGDKYKLFKGNEEILLDYLNESLSISFHPITLDDMLELNSQNKENSIIITDQGRTAFNQPEMTAMAVAPKNLKYRQFIRDTVESKDKEKIAEKYLSKQVMVINKELIKDKWEMFEVVAKCSIKFLIELISSSEDKKTINVEKEAISSWLDNSFAKITLKPSEKSFSEIEKEASNAKELGLDVEFLFLSGKNKCVAFGPDFVSKVDPHTKKGYSLA